MAEPGAATIDRGQKPVDTEANKKPTDAKEASPKRFSIARIKSVISGLRPKAALEAITRKNIVGDENEQSGKVAEKTPPGEEPPVNTKDAKPGRHRAAKPGRVRSTVRNIFATPETPTLDSLDLTRKTGEPEASVDASTAQQPVEPPAKTDVDQVDAPTVVKPDVVDTPTVVKPDEIDTPTVVEPDPAEPEKTPAERLADAKDRLQKLSPNIDLDRPDIKALLADAAANPENLENLEDLLDVVDDRVNEIVNNVDVTPEQLARLNERELASVLETYKDLLSNPNLDQKSPEAKKLSWKMKLLIALLAAIVVPMAGAGLTLAAAGNIAKSQQ